MAGPKTCVEHDLLHKAERKKIETMQFQKPDDVFYPLWSFPLVYFSLSRQCERAGGEGSCKARLLWRRERASERHVCVCKRGSSVLLCVLSPMWYRVSRGGGVKGAAEVKNEKSEGG